MGAGFQGHIVDLHLHGVSAIHIVIFYHTVAVDLLAVDVQVGELTARHGAQHGLAALGHGDGVIVAVNDAGEGVETAFIQIAGPGLALLQGADGRPAGRQSDVGSDDEIGVLGISAGSNMVAQLHQIRRTCQLVGSLFRAAALQLGDGDGQLGLDGVIGYGDLAALVHGAGRHGVESAVLQLAGGAVGIGCGEHHAGGVKGLAEPIAHFGRGLGNLQLGRHALIAGKLYGAVQLGFCLSGDAGLVRAAQGVIVRLQLIHIVAVGGPLEAAHIQVLQNAAQRIRMPAG